MGKELEWLQVLLLEGIQDCMPTDTEVQLAQMWVPTDQLTIAERGKSYPWAGVPVQQSSHRNEERAELAAWLAGFTLWMG